MNSVVSNPDFINKHLLSTTVPVTSGLHCEVKVLPHTTSCRLPITPLITSNHPIDETG